MTTYVDNARQPCARCQRLTLGRSKQGGQIVASCWRCQKRDEFSRVVRWSLSSENEAVAK